MELIFATHNDNKVKEINKLLPPGYLVKSLTDLKYDAKIEELGSTLEENALIKARTIFNAFKENCFADDSGLEVYALGGKPGVYSARYAGNQKKPEENNKKILHELKDLNYRQAQFRTVIALIFNKTEYLFEGIIKGKISETPLGHNGFGYDPIFIPEKEKLTFSQLTLSEKNKISHRSRAFQKLVEFLKS